MDESKLIKKRTLAVALAVTAALPQFCVAPKTKAFGLAEVASWGIRSAAVTTAIIALKEIFARKPEGIVVSSGLPTVPQPTVPLPETALPEGDRDTFYDGDYSPVGPKFEDYDVGAVRTAPASKKRLNYEHFESQFEHWRQVLETEPECPAGGVDTETMKSIKSIIKAVNTIHERLVDLQEEVRSLRLPKHYDTDSFNIEGYTSLFEGEAPFFELLIKYAKYVILFANKLKNPEYLCKHIKTGEAVSFSSNPIGLFYFLLIRFSKDVGAFSGGRDLNLGDYPEVGDISRHLPFVIPGSKFGQIFKFNANIIDSQREVCARVESPDSLINSYRIYYEIFLDYFSKNISSGYFSRCVKTGITDKFDHRIDEAFKKIVRLLKKLISSYQKNIGIMDLPYNLEKPKVKQLKEEFEGANSFSIDVMSYFLFESERQKKGPINSPGSLFSLPPSMYLENCLEVWRHCFLTIFSSFSANENFLKFLSENIILKDAHKTKLDSDFKELHRKNCLFSNVLRPYYAKYFDTDAISSETLPPEYFFDGLKQVCYRLYRDERLSYFSILDQLGDIIEGSLDLFNDITTALTWEGKHSVASKKDEIICVGESTLKWGRIFHIK
ncbi:MAG: hypothetical protein LBP36_02875 [Oscillospiraceae bacterium]|nr:hypothetical protein [Oscillospiraceae bacterium]